MIDQDLAEKIWRQVEPTVFISRQQFIDGLENWEITPRQIDGKIIGATLTDGPEFHFVTFDRGNPVPRALIADCLQPIIDRHGFVNTSTPRDDVRQRRFNERIGFRVESDDEYFTYFRMERMNLHGTQKCL